MDVIHSVRKVPIRMTDERWFHIVENHNDMAGRYDDILAAVEEPDMILRGYKDALLAVRKMKIGKWIVVVYKETSKNDGFIVTAYQTSKIRSEDIIWRKNT